MLILIFENDQTQHQQGDGDQVPAGPGQQRLSRDGPSPEQHKGSSTAAAR